MSDIEHAAIGNRAGRRQRSQGSWREHGAVRVIKVKLREKQRTSVDFNWAGERKRLTGVRCCRQSNRQAGVTRRSALWI
jgi:hypothetical protein